MSLFQKLPFNWANWSEFEKRPGFICWAEPIPASPNQSRYAIVSGKEWNRSPGIAWVCVSPNPAVRPECCNGRFYDDCPDHPEGAVAWAIASALRHKVKVAGWLAELDAAVDAAPRR